MFGLPNPYLIGAAVIAACEINRAGWRCDLLPDPDHASPQGGQNG
jgi:hypothetical protein